MYFRISIFLCAVGIQCREVSSMTVEEIRRPEKELRSRFSEKFCRCNHRNALFTKRRRADFEVVILRSHTRQVSMLLAIKIRFNTFLCHTLASAKHAMYIV